MASVYLGLGANIGNREANLRMALRTLGRMAKVTHVSSLYETEPVGPEQPDFYNAVCEIETGLRPRALLRFLQAVEHEIGRRPGESSSGGWGPRPIDIDLLLYGDEVIEEEGLVVPHPEMLNRAFVMVPLAEIAADARYPGREETIAELAAALDAGGVRKVADAGWDGLEAAKGAGFRA